MKNLYNIYAENENDKCMIQATIPAENELQAQRHYYNNCLVTKKCFEFQYFAEKVISGGPVLIWDKKQKCVTLGYSI